MYIQVSSVVAKENFTVLLTYENGEQRSFDMKPYLTIGLFKELNNFELFQTVKPSFDTISWANDLDIDPEILYGESSSVKFNI